MDGSTLMENSNEQADATRLDPTTIIILVMVTLVKLQAQMAGHLLKKADTCE